MNADVCTAIHTYSYSSVIDRSCAKKEFLSRLYEHIYCTIVEVAVCVLTHFFVANKIQSRSRLGMSGNGEALQCETQQQLECNDGDDEDEDAEQEGMSRKTATTRSTTTILRNSASVTSEIQIDPHHQTVVEQQSTISNSSSNSRHSTAESGGGNGICSSRKGKKMAAWKLKPGKMGKKMVGMIFRVPQTKKMAEGVVTSSGCGEASIFHALVVIFLEFFAWGLLTSPMITVLNETFPDRTFLMNGLIVGIKGLLSFLSAPLVGALSDIWGRKFFLLITVFFTCAPIPLMKINTWWYFAMISISGVFAVTFSVVFAYVADVTDESDRSFAYGLVSATFAASLVTSPALGAYLEMMYSEEVVVAVATAIAVLDVFFIMVAVPESLPEKCRPGSRSLTLEQVDPFAALRKMWKDKTILMLCVTVFLSYLPEAGQYSCFFVYLRLVMGFSKEAVATFIAAVGILSVLAQTGLMAAFMKTLGSKHTIMVGLLFEMLQLMWYGFGSQTWMMWAAGVLAAVSSITYPAISAFVSMHADADKQGLVQGMITGMRGLCNGLGPAMFGLIFSLFRVDLSEHPDEQQPVHHNQSTYHEDDIDAVTHIIPGPPFVFGALLVILALMVAAFIPESLPVGSGCGGGNSVHDDSIPPLAIGSVKNEKRRNSSFSMSHVDKKKSDDDDDDDDDREFTVPLIHSNGASAL